jgi:hypothetical protein
LFDLFNIFSAKSVKYNLKECKLKWKEYEKNNKRCLTIVSLIKITKEDNLKKYKEAVNKIKILFYLK